MSLINKDIDQIYNETISLYFGTNGAYTQAGSYLPAIAQGIVRCPFIPDLIKIDNLTYAELYYFKNANGSAYAKSFYIETDMLNSIIALFSSDKETQLSGYTFTNKSRRLFQSTYTFTLKELNATDQTVAGAIPVLNGTFAFNIVFIRFKD